MGVLTAEYANTSPNVGKWVGGWAIELVSFEFEFTMARYAGIRVASESIPDETYVCTQHPHSHSCSCPGATFHTAHWHREAFRLRETPKVCKHVARLIEAGIFHKPPKLFKSFQRVIELYETERFSDLELIDGKFCVPRSRTDGRMVEVKFVFPNAVTMLAGSY